MPSNSVPFLDLILGPHGGLFALGVAFGALGAWGFFKKTALVVAEERLREAHESYQRRIEENRRTFEAQIQHQREEIDRLRRDSLAEIDRLREETHQEVSELRQEVNYWRDLYLKHVQLEVAPPTS